MPASVTVTTDKTQYAPGEQIVVTLTLDGVPADTVKTYEARGEVPVNGVDVRGAAGFSVVNSTSVGDPEAYIAGTPGIALTPHPTLPNTWVGVAPAI